MKPIEPGRKLNTTFRTMTSNAVSSKTSYTGERVLLAFKSGVRRLSMIRVRSGLYVRSRQATYTLSTYSLKVGNIRIPGLGRRCDSDQCTVPRAAAAGRPRPLSQIPFRTSHPISGGPPPPLLGDVPVWTVRKTEAPHNLNSSQSVRYPHSAYKQSYKNKKKQAHLYMIYARTASNPTTTAQDGQET